MQEEMQIMLMEALESIARSEFKEEERPMASAILKDSAKVLARLSQKEKIILSLREGGLTLKDIGRQLNVTTERVRQIEKKAKWRVTTYLKSCIVRNMNERVELHLLLEEERELILNLKDRIPKLRALIDYIDGLSSLPYFSEPPVTVQEVLDRELRSLDLSVRAYHCLTSFLRRKLNKSEAITLRDVATLTADELLTIRGFGKKCQQEVLKRLEECGIFLRRY